MNEPVQENDGSFRVPSLRNMKALKELSCSSETNLGLLDAIVYMTLAKFLVPLEEVKVIHPVEMKKSTLIQYERILAQFHKDVNISVNDFSDDEEGSDDDALNNENMAEDLMGHGMGLMTSRTMIRNFRDVGIQMKKI